MKENISYPYEFFWCVCYYDSEPGQVYDIDITAEAMVNESGTYCDEADCYLESFGRTT